MAARLFVVVLFAAVSAACTGQVGEPAAAVGDVAVNGSAVLVLGDETHEFVVLERCLVTDDGDVLVKGVGSDDDALRLEVVRGPSPVVDGALVDEITVTRDREPWVAQAIPSTTTAPTPLWTVEGSTLSGQDIEFRRADQPVATVAGSIEVTCP